MGKNIAIDGPSGAGKSTISKEIASRLGYIYVDTGALYRSIGWYTLQKGLDPADSEQVIPLLKEITPELCYMNGSQHVLVNGEDVSEKIRLPQVSMAASAVSAIPEVRAFLFDLQLKIARENNVIMDGRDIGTVVLPHADVKIFLTASPEDRAQRRWEELQSKGTAVSYHEVLTDIIQRDYQDTHRDIAPLKKAADAILVDTTGFLRNQSVEKITKIILEKLKEVPSCTQY